MYFRKQPSTVAVPQKAAEWPKDAFPKPQLPGLEGEETEMAIGNSYAFLLFEDIQNYHQQNTSATAAASAFSLPVCVSCSILEVVADLDSTSSENKSFPVAMEDRQ
jgi:hypothetical protein